MDRLAADVARIAEQTGLSETTIWIAAITVIGFVALNLLAEIRRLVK